MANPIEFIKEHPVGVGVGVFAVGVAFLLLRSGGGNSQAPIVMSNASAVEAGSQLAVAQMAASAQVNSVNQQAAVASQKIAADLELGKLQALTVNNTVNMNADVQKQANTLNYNLAYYKTGLDAKSNDLESTLTAQVSMAGIAADVEKYKTGVNAQVSIASLSTNLQALLAGYQHSEVMQRLELEGVATSQAIQDIQTKLDHYVAYTESLGRDMGWLGQYVRDNVMNKTGAAPAPTQTQVINTTTTDNTLLNSFMSQVNAAISALTGKVDTAQKKADDSWAYDVALQESLHRLRVETGQAVAAINEWTVKNWGGVVAPGLFTGAKTLGGSYTNT